MKLRKTRIKKETKAGGKVEYIAEYKTTFYWQSFYDWGQGTSVFASDCLLAYAKKHPDVRIRTEEFAKGVIDTYIARVKYNNACDIENKIVKTEYQRYP